MRRMDERLAESGKPARLFSFGAIVKMLPFLLRPDLFAPAGNLGHTVGIVKITKVWI
jgi:hypothetical protein